MDRIRGRCLLCSQKLDIFECDDGLISGAVRVETYTDAHGVNHTNYACAECASAFGMIAHTGTTETRGIRN